MAKVTITITDAEDGDPDRFQAEFKFDPIVADTAWEHLTAAQRIGCGLFGLVRSGAHPMDVHHYPVSPKVVN